MKRKHQHEKLRRERARRAARRASETMVPDNELWDEVRREIDAMSTEEALEVYDKLTMPDEHGGKRDGKN